MHTPASLVHEYRGSDPWDRFFTDLRQLPAELAILGINDYLFIDGYRRVLDEWKAGRLPNIEAVFPVVELRLDQLVAAGQGLQKINYHIIFDPDLEPETIEAQFIVGLANSFELQPGSAGDFVWSGFASLQNLEALGAAIRASAPSDVEYSESDRLLGFNAFVVPRETVTELLDNSALRHRWVAGLGKTEWASLRWNDQSIAQKKHLINSVDLVFTAADSPAAYDASLTKLREQGVNHRLLDCSDAHTYSDSTDKDRVGNSMTWINADPTLKGLRHALSEFPTRVFVGNRPPKLRELDTRPGEHIKVIQIRRKASTDSSNRFFEVDQAINPGFVAVIGNKGHGKSALMDGIGLAANSQNESHFTFLSRERFRNPKANWAQMYEASLRWVDDEVMEVSLDDHVDPDAVERVSYLPQNLIDVICDPEPGPPGERFEQELNSVLFAHVPPQDRLGTTSLEGLIRVRSDAIQQRLDQLRSELRTLNRTYARIERESRPEKLTKLKSLRERLQAQIDALSSEEPQVGPAPDPAKDSDLQELRAKIDRAQQTKTALEGELAKATENAADIAKKLEDASQLKAAIETHMTQHQIWQRSNREKAYALGLDLDQLITQHVNLGLLDEAITALEVDREVLAKGLNPEEEDSLAHRFAQTSEELAAAARQLDEPARLHRAAVERHGAWARAIRDLAEGTDDRPGLAQVESEITGHASLPAKLEALQASRLETLRTIHGTLLNLVGLYEDLYDPARRFISGHHLAREAKLEFSAVLRERNLDSRLWDVVARNIAGSFFGIDEGSARLQAMIDAVNWNESESVVEFVRDLDKALHSDLREGQNGGPVDPERAIRKGYSLEDLYDIVYSLNYLEPFYQLQYSGTPLDRLSPGQRGTLLLMFYLLVDPDRRPLLLDQPDENLDNETINDLLVPAIKEATTRRQVIVVTHSPNVAVVADADQVIVARFDGTVEYQSGAIESPAINELVVDVLEGTWPAFENREDKYQPPAT